MYLLRCSSVAFSFGTTDPYQSIFLSHRGVDNVRSQVLMFSLCNNERMRLPADFLKGHRRRMLQFVKPHKLKKMFAVTVPVHIYFFVLLCFLPLRCVRQLLLSQNWCFKKCVWTFLSDSRTNLLTSVAIFVPFVFVDIVLCLISFVAFYGYLWSYLIEVLRCFLFAKKEYKSIGVSVTLSP